MNLFVTNSYLLNIYGKDLKSAYWKNQLPSIFSTSKISSRFIEIPLSTAFPPFAFLIYRGGSKSVTRKEHVGRSIIVH